jgi:Spy/CpxP family protein refolding chaperone
MLTIRQKLPAATLLASVILGTGLAAAAQPADRPPRQGGKRENDPSQYTIAQATSDQAQLHTIAFSGLAFISGDFGASTFIPPGKVCDFFGFQYMRDIDAAQKGHNPMFLNRVAGNVLTTLNDEQKKRFADLAVEQSPQLEQLARMRLPLIKAFCRELNGEIPAGSAGLNQAATVKAVGDIFAYDGELSCRRAEIMATVARSLTPEQKAYFGKMKFGDFNSWPAIDERDKLKKEGRGQSKLFNVAYMTCASEFFSWTAGNLEADTYFCPERHGTYFGGFYMKDMPAMGKRDYNISLSVTGDSGKEFLGALSAIQRQHITGIIELQRQPMNEMITVRRAISSELRKFLAGETPDKAKVVDLCRHYGELDGQVSWLYTTAFAKVNKTLTAEQRAILAKLRNLDGYVSAPYYIYSQAMKEVPTLPDTTPYFFPPKR